MELADLRAFVRIAEHGSISAAARASKQPKSSVSRGLARLEASVGAALVDRSSQHLRLTDAGALLRERAVRLLDEADDVRAALDGLAARPQGRLKVNVPYTFAIGLLAPMLAGFIARFPEIRIVLDIDNRLVNLHAEDLDLAVRIGTLADSELVARKLTTVELWTCASPAYLAMHGSPERPADLAEHRLITRLDEVASWTYRTTDDRLIAVEVRPGTVVPEPAVVLALLQNGVGIGRLPDFIARNAIAEGGLVQVLADLGSDSVDVHALYTSRRALSTKARVFIEALQAHLSTPGLADAGRTAYTSPHGEP